MAMKFGEWIGLMCLALLAIGVSQAQAEQKVTAHITTLEASYVPNQVTFTIDKPIDKCPIGHWLIWNIESPNITGNPQESVKAVYAAALAAVVSGKAISFFIADDDNGKCLGKHFYVESSQ